MLADSKKVVEYLGGRRTLKVPAGRSERLSTLIEAGLPMSALDAFTRRFDYSMPDLERALGFKERTLFRHKHTGRLSPLVSDRLTRLARLTASAVEVMEDEREGYQWMTEPADAFGGRRPIDLVATDTGAEQVRALLLRMEHSIY